jgi:hypothetical protein
MNTDGATSILHICGHCGGPMMLLATTLPAMRLFPLPGAD